MITVFTSYKNTPGFKMFGKDWEPIHELNLYHGELRCEESVLIRKLLHIGHKLSSPNCKDREIYMLVLKDLHRRVAEVSKEREDLEDLIGRSFDELLVFKQFS